MRTSGRGAAPRLRRVAPSRWLAPRAVVRPLGDGGRPQGGGSHPGPRAPGGCTSGPESAAPPVGFPPFRFRFDFDPHAADPVEKMRRSSGEDEEEQI
jgi:hypothetical protein